MTDAPWYRNAAVLQAALNGHRTWAALAKATGVKATTLKSAGKDLDVTPPEDAALDVQVKELQKQNRRLLLGDAQMENVMRRLEERIDQARPRLTWPATVKKATGKRTAQEMGLLYSDLHASEVVTLAGTRGINEYNWDIMLERMGLIQSSVFSHQEHFGFTVSKLHVFMLGDMLSGDIHDELAITNDRPTAEAIIDLAYEHLPWLLGFAEEFPQVQVSCVPGNHPRFAKKPSAKQYHNNADWLFYKTLEALLRDHSQFTFSIPLSSMNVVMICDRWRALLMHGDGIRTTMPGVPWGGVHRRVTTLEAQFTKSRTPLDYVMFGHWHTLNSLDGIQARTLMNGSAKGADEYSLQMFGSGRDASQLLTTFHPRRGLTGMYPLDLQGVVPASEGW